MLFFKGTVRVHYKIHKRKTKRGMRTHRPNQTIYEDENFTRDSLNGFLFKKFFCCRQKFLQLYQVRRIWLIISKKRIKFWYFWKIRAFNSMEKFCITNKDVHIPLSLWYSPWLKKTYIYVSNFSYENRVVCIPFEHKMT